VYRGLGMQNEPSDSRANNPFAPPPDFNPYAPPAADTDEPVGLPESSSWINASRGSRLAARILDGLVETAPAIPGFLLLVGEEDESAMQLIGYALIAIGMLGVSIYQWYLLCTTGQTLGKKWLRIRVVRISGEPLGFVHGVVLRNWAMLILQSIPYLGTLIGLVNVMMIFGGDYRCMHDHLAGTRVVDASMG